MDDNKDVVIGVIEYLKTYDIKYLDKDINLVKNIFNYLVCDEWYILNILLSENYQYLIKNNNKKKIKKIIKKTI
mgnify:CR=1 FL=1